MHGRKRSEYKAYQRDAAVSAKMAEKAQQFRAIDLQLLKMRQEPSSEIAVGTTTTTTTTTVLPVDNVASSSVVTDARKKTLELTKKVLTVNPDPLTLWNHRRELLLQLFAADTTSTNSSTSTSESPVVTTTTAAAAVFPIDPELDLTRAALSNNPKAYGAWFHRKWALQHYLLRCYCCCGERSSSSTTNVESTTSATTTETEKQADPVALLSTELELTVLFLQRDERNFHCWNYRRFVVSCLLQVQVLATTTDSVTKDCNTAIITGGTTPTFDGSWETTLLNTTTSYKPAVFCMGAQVATPTTTTSSSSSSSIVSESTTAASTMTAAAAAASTFTILQTEWNFTTLKIRDNFSNFSAFHYRSKLWPLILQQEQQEADKDTVQSLWTREFGLVENAVFTEPDDQTAWWYHRFLLDSAARYYTTSTSTSTSTSNDTAVHNDKTSDHDWYKNLLEQQKSQLEELAEEVADSKWVWLGLCLVLERLGGGDGGDDLSTQQQQGEIYARLMELDPDRRERYRALWKKTQQQQKQSL
jgi:hypothetical protein